MKYRKIISLVFIIIGSLLITTVSYAWVSPGSFGVNNELDITLFDENGKEIPKEEGFRLFDADNIYPGWSNSYTLRIKNKKNKLASYTITIDFEDKDTGLYLLSDVLALKSEREGNINEFRLKELKNKLLQKKTEIGAGKTHVYNFTLSMDEEAGNEYQNLSLDVELIVSAELAQEHHDPGNNSGGSKDDPIKIDPDEKPDDPIEELPHEEPIEDQPTPEEPIPDDHFPDRGNGSKDRDIILPKTGGLPIQILLATGILLIVTGIVLRNDSLSLIRYKKRR
ncbi:MAG: hypothetical protein GX957_01100 [Clostridiaceae bacterium]|nr:hypothetical protein [Clostridiaceae bacterium]